MCVRHVQPLLWRRGFECGMNTNIKSRDSNVLLEESFVFPHLFGTLCLTQNVLMLKDGVAFRVNVMKAFRVFASLHINP